MTTAAKTRDLAFHEAANVFPMMEEHELDELGKDIAENGLQVPIQLYDGKIIDGRNRYKACLIHCPDRIYCEDVTNEVEDPIAHVRSLNLHRRHLSPSQLTMCAARCREIYDKQAKDRQKLSEGRGKKGKEILPYLNDGGQSRDKAAADWGVSGKSVDKATTVLKHATPDVVESVERGRMTVSTAAKAARLPEPIQKKAAKVAKEEGNKAAVKVVDEHLTREGLYTDAVGTKYAHKAIGQLKKIPPTDKLRTRGFEIVAKWIVENK